MIRTADQAHPTFSMPLPKNHREVRRSICGWALSAIFLWVVVLSGSVNKTVAQNEQTVERMRDGLVHPEMFPTSNPKLDRYVSIRGSDSNDGTQEHPWATISHAGAFATPGTIVHVAPGLYAEAVVTPASGTATARITYFSDQIWSAIVAAPGRDGFAWRNGGNYTDIIGFEIAGERCGGIGLGASFQRAIFNHVHNSASGCISSDGGSGINDFNYATQGNDILGNYVHDVGINEPSCGQFQHNYIQGIYQANAGGRIDHNISAKNCGFGIHLWHAATHATITNNSVVGNKAGGILIGSGDAPCSTTGCPEGNDYTIVKNNIVAYNGNAVSGGWGLGETSSSKGKTGYHNQYSHNLSFQNPSGDFYLPVSVPCRGCITGKDPRFISRSTGDYRLATNSPAAGAGEIVDAEHAAADIGALAKGTRAAH